MATVADPRDIIIAPVISEKSYGLLDQNWYTFLVHPDANKTAIKIAIEKIFNVRVVDGQHQQPAGQAQAHPYRLGPAQGDQAGAGQARRRRPDRGLRRPGELRERRRHGHP